MCAEIKLEFHFMFLTFIKQAGAILTQKWSFIEQRIE